MRLGEIAVEDAARRFVVRARDTQTLKDLLVARGRSGAQEVWALRGVTLHVEPGGAVGLVGRNGSGKSTLLRLIAGIIKPTRGRVAAAGRVGSLLELGAGFHPDFTGRENVFLNGSVQGLRRREIRERFDEIVAFAELEHAIDRPVRTYSSGMYMRLGFAIAAFLQADVLLLDEVFAVGDEAFQRKCFGRIAEFKAGGGTIVFVSHDAAAVERLCERAVLLRDGIVGWDGPVHETLARYRRQLADDEALGGDFGASPSELAVRVTDSAGRAQTQILAGDPLVIELAADPAARGRAARVRVELRDDAGLLVAESDAAVSDLGWSEHDGTGAARLDVASPPLHFGRFHVSAELLDADGGLLLSAADAVVFVVYPDDDSRALVQLGGSWSGSANQASR